MQRNAIHWGGMLLAMGALLLGVARLMVPLAGEATAPSPAASLLLFAAGLLVTLALPALYARQADAAGALGLAGHVLLHTGMMLAVVYAAAPLMYPSLEGPPAENAFGLLLGIALLLGLLLTAAATIRAGVYPRWAGIALLAATAGFLAEFFIAELLPPAASQVSAAFFSAAFALALAWLGLSAWRDRPRDVG